jgi:CheY-like chemotaxis protein/HPt (histidine-containing phosphotransfer) domain-containing protein
MSSSARRRETVDGASPGAGGSARVLLAEDNQANRKLALAMLGRLGYRVDAVSNGLQAITAAFAEPYDVILMDCRMPELDGFQATAEIRRRERHPTRIPIIAMTADAMEGDRQRCLDAGMDDYIAKPVTMESLSEVLRRWVPASGTPPPFPSASPDGDPGESVSLDPAIVRMLRQLGDRSGGGTPHLVSEFLEDAASNLQRTGVALERGEVGTAAERAHALGGTAATFGARRMGGLSRRIQRLCAEGQVDRARETLGELRQELDRVTDLLRAEFPIPREGEG